MKNLSYSARIVQPSFYLYTKTEKMIFEFPTPNCFSVICIAQVTARKGYQVNFTIIKVVSLQTGCLLWGLSTVRDNNQESQIICQNITDFSTRSFYSLHSTLSIVIYNYMKDSYISILGVISQTRCKTVHLDPCLFSISYCKSLAEAKLYLSRITEHTNLNLVANDFISTESIKKEIFFHLSKNSCAIIQMGNVGVKTVEFVQPCEQETLCRIHLSPLTTNNFISSSKGEISGEYSFIEIYQIKNFSYEKIFSNTFEKLSFNRQSVSAIAIHEPTVMGMNWIDITIKKYEMTYITDFFWYFHALQRRANLIPTFIQYAPALIADYDLHIEIVRNNPIDDVLVLTSNMRVLHEKGFSLFYNCHKKYYIHHSKF